MKRQGAYSNNHCDLWRGKVRIVTIIMAHLEGFSLIVTILETP